MMSEKQQQHLGVISWAALPVYVFNAQKMAGDDLVKIQQS